jgi:hypothetical protein
MVDFGDAGLGAARHRRPHPTAGRTGEAAMQRQPAKIVPFTTKLREVRGRLTSTGELIRTLPVPRSRGDDDGPRAA